MADETPLHDPALEETLTRVAEQQRPDPAFAERLRQQLKTRTATGNAPPPVATPKTRLRLNRRIVSAAVAFAAAAAAVWTLAPRPGLLAPLPPVTRTVPADSPVVLRAPPGSRAGVAIAKDGRTLLRLELRDRAEVTYRPGERPRLELTSGFLRVAGTDPFDLRAGDHEFSAEGDCDVAFELSRNIEGGMTMRKLWLIPTSAVSGAALTLAVLVTQGRVAFSRGGETKVPAAGEVLVLKPGDPAGAPQAQRRLAELEKKVSSLQQENGRLAGQLAQRKGVTPASIREQFAALKRAGLPGLAPGAHADLIADLKGLGEEGVKLMLELLKSGDEKERFLAANLLEQLNAPAAIPGLRQAALNDPDKMAATMAGHALALMDDAATVPALREIADANKNWQSRVNALWGLSKHGDQKAMAEALAAMKDPKIQPQMKVALGANLMLLPDPELQPIVDETMRQFGHEEEQVAMLGIEYYKSVGTAEARARLEAMAADPKLSEAVRTAARKALSTPAK